MKQEIDGVERAKSEYVGCLKRADSQALACEDSDADGSQPQHSGVVCAITKGDDAGWPQFLYKASLVLATGDDAQRDTKHLFELGKVAMCACGERVEGKMLG